MSPEVDRALTEAMAGQRLRIVASLIGLTGDWDLAEDAVADAAERALRTWPRDGIPDNPAAWMTSVARRRAVDVIRRAVTERAKLAELPVTGEVEMPEVEDLPDDRLRLVFTCCHPALSLEQRVALTLKVVCGLSTAAVARMFLVSEPTAGQRLLRAKQKIANAGIPYREPPAGELAGRLDGVLAVVYLVFTEGWSGGADAELVAEALRLGRLLLGLMPAEDEVRALVALMLLQWSRRDARTVDGALVTLEDQDRSRWDPAAITEALHLLRAGEGGDRGPYRIQAELAAVHAGTEDAATTDWARIVSLYSELLALHPSPVVALNRAIAIGMADGPLAGLAELDALAGERALRSFHLLAAARGDLLARAGRLRDAADELARAAALAPTEAEREQLELRRAALGAAERAADGG